MAQPAGVTALGMAYNRAYHAAHDSPKIFDDFLAKDLFTANELAQTEKFLVSYLPMHDPALAATNPDPGTALAAVMQLGPASMTLGRSRYAEDCLEESLHEGVQQYVILGAGLDTFAFRRPELTPRLQVFEVDHPATQAVKRERIAAAGWELPSHTHLVPVDLNRESLGDALQRSPYDPDRLSFFSWLGVTFYLTREVNFSTLQTIAGISAPGNNIVFDYMDTDALIPEKAGKRVQFALWAAERLGEPMQCGFDPATLGDDLRGLGFDLVENLSPSQIQARYFQGRSDRYTAFEHMYYARAVVSAR